MRKHLIFFMLIVFAAAVSLSACGDSESSTYQFLSFGTPEGFTQTESSDEPLFENGDGKTISIHIDEPDMLTAEEMLQNRLDSDDVEQYDDLEVAGITCKNTYFYDRELDVASGNVYMIYDDKLVTFTLSSYKENISEDLASAFGEFLNTVQIAE